MRHLRNIAMKQVFVALEVRNLVKVNVSSLTICAGLSRTTFTFLFVAED